MPTEHASADEDLVGKINESISGGGSVDTNLNTDERVLARVTDGIYRQPASALRELVANAYDADAKNVSISTDAPRFSAIKISDDGNGMGPEALANLVLHIGGSAKRTLRGPEIGVASKKDPSRSKGGRRLIGKIGIGLFSVAQLTRQFTIITKTAGTKHQLLAHVTLNRFDESELSKVDAAGKHNFRAGSARIWAEKPPDEKGHGTTIELTTLLPRVVHILQSRDVWEAIHEEQEAHGRVTRVPPLFHIGEINPDQPNSLAQDPNLPWNESDRQTEWFSKLVDGVASAWKENNHYARLAHALDNYFQAIWSLGLSLPLEYIDRHPYTLTGKDVMRVFSLPDRRRQTKLNPIEVGPRQTVGDRAGLQNDEDPASGFTVTVDGVRLCRPIRFNGYPQTTQALQGPVLFIGKATPDLSKIPETQRGGPLSFSGYFFWTPRVIPQEHNGILIRINGASGTLFDPTFLKYQIGERRLSQLFAEVFVHNGLDGALNIDRESFNTAHPHYQVLANWVHNSLRLIRNTLKALQSDALKQRRRDETNGSDESDLTAVVDELIGKFTEFDNPSDVPSVVLAADADERNRAVTDGKISYLKQKILSIAIDPKDEARQPWIESRAAAVARLLEAFGILNHLDRSDQERLIGSIVNVFLVGK